MASTSSSLRASAASASPATWSRRAPQREARLSDSWMSAPSWLRPEVTPPPLRPAPTQPPLTSSATPGVSTSICLTASVVVASLVAIAAVPTRTPSTGMAVSPCASAQRPVRKSTARSGVPMPPPTQTTRLSTLRRSAYVARSRSSRSSHEWCPPATPPSMWAITEVSTSRAIASTWRICFTVPGLNTTWLMPASCRSSMMSTASSRSGMPALSTSPSKGAPASLAFCSNRWLPTCILHR